MVCVWCGGGVSGHWLRPVAEACVEEDAWLAWEKAQTIVPGSSESEQTSMSLTYSCLGRQTEKGRL